MVAVEHHDDQFVLAVRSLLKVGSMSTKEIVTAIDTDMNFSYQMTRNRLEELVDSGILAKQYRGREAIYSLQR